MPISEYIDLMRNNKNNEKGVRCFLHPKEKNSSFCFECNIHICEECKKSKKHIGYRKDDIIEVFVTDEIKKILNGIIDIYKERLEKLNKIKGENEAGLFNKKEDDKAKKDEQRKDKIKEIQKQLKKELLGNEKILNKNLYNLKLQYENKVNLCKSQFNINKEVINKKYERLIDYYNNIFNEELNKIEKEYNNYISNLEHNKKINTYQNLYFSKTKYIFSN